MKHDINERNITPLNAQVPLAVSNISQLALGPNSNLRSKALAAAGLATLIGAPIAIKRLARDAEYAARKQISKIT